jgi:heptosyltransferase III
MPHFNYITFRKLGKFILMSEIKRILVVRTDRIGDLVLTLPMIDILRMNYPEAHIAMMTRNYTSELALNCKSLNEVILYDDDKGRVPFKKMLDRIRGGSYDVAFIAYPRIRIALLLLLAGVRYRVGSGFRFYSIFFNKRIFEHRKYAEKHELEYNLTLLEKFGCTLKKITPPWIQVPDENISSVRTKLIAAGVSGSERLVVVHAGSGGSSRDWSFQKFSELGKKIVNISGIKVILTGGKDEKSLVRDLQKTIGPGAIDMSGALSLVEYAGISKLASLFIGNSTGPLHIAAAVGTNVIGFFSHIKPMTPDRWGPYTETKKVFVPKGQPEYCKKCIKNKKNCECMDSISVDEVFKAALQLLE